MSKSVLKNLDLSDRHTMASSNRAARAITVHNVDELLEWCQDPLVCDDVGHGLVWVLGQGSNVIFGADFPGTVMFCALKGTERLTVDTASSTEVWRVAAGESWHAWVEQSVDAGLSGLENLALIPGTVGAAPVQNIGAYGSDLSQSCVGVQAVDLRTGLSRCFTREACAFAYRDSIFKHPDHQFCWFITSVDFQLTRHFSPNVTYPDLQRMCPNPQSPRDVFDAVSAIRAQKLPDPAEIPNVGSFFKNPVVPRAQADRLRERLPQLPIFELSLPDHVKLSAAYLIEQAGLKGYVRGGVGVYAHHALVLVRHQPGPGAEIVALARDIQECVWDQFEVHLEIEPVVWRG